MSRAGNNELKRAYHVQAVLGSGGFGAVYRAKYVGEGNFSKIVALKVLHADMAAVGEVAMRMRDEARMLGLLRHRNIVQVDRLVQLNGHWTIVMEFVDGVDLKAISRHEPLPVGPALEVVSEVASALHQAYNFVPLDDSIPEDERKPLEILHRDIKPANIQITRHGDVKVLDFGIARGNFDAREAKTQELFFGSPEYTAPERFDLEETPAGDIYSLGCVLYEALMGKAYGRTSARPTQHNDLIEARLKLLDQTTLKGEAPEVLQFLTDLLAYEGKDRPSARDVIRRCARLRAKHTEHLLRDWAEGVVPPLIAERPEHPPDDLTGSTLYEQVTGSQPMPRPQKTERRAPPRKRPPLSKGEEKPRRSIREAFEQQVAEQQPAVAEPAVPEQAPAPKSEPAAETSAEALTADEAPPASEPGAATSQAKDTPAAPAPSPAQDQDQLPTGVVPITYGQEPVELGRDATVVPSRPKPDPTKPEIKPKPAPSPDQLPTGMIPVESLDEPATDPGVQTPRAAPLPTRPKGKTEPPPTSRFDEVKSKRAPAPKAQPTPVPSPPSPAEEDQAQRRPAWVIPVGVLGAVGMAAALVLAFNSFDGSPSVQTTSETSLSDVLAATGGEVQPSEDGGAAVATGAEANKAEDAGTTRTAETQKETIEHTSLATAERSAESANTKPKVEAKVQQKVADPVPDPIPVEPIAPAGTSMVHVQGQDLGVILTRGNESFDVPGWVPPGTYTMTAEFPNVGRTNTGSITVVAGADANIKCDAAFGSCKQL